MLWRCFIARLPERLHYVQRHPRDAARSLVAMAVNSWDRVRDRCWPAPRVSCELCGWRGRRFAHFRERHFVRAGVQCPRCGSLPRNRRLLDHLGTLLREHPARSALEIAPVLGTKERLAALGVVRYEAIDRDRRRPVTRTMDVCAMDFAEATFDLVLCSHVLEHVGAWELALEEIHRVLTPGGLAIVDVPFRSRGPTRRIHPPDHQGHVHSFGEDIVGLLSRPGFEVEPHAYVAEQGLAKPENVFFVCRRS